MLSAASLASEGTEEQHREERVLDTVKGQITQTCRGEISILLDPCYSSLTSPNAYHRPFFLLTFFKKSSPKDVFLF